MAESLITKLEKDLHKRRSTKVMFNGNLERGLESLRGDEKMSEDVVDRFKEMLLEGTKPITKDFYVWNSALITGYTSFPDMDAQKRYSTPSKYKRWLAIFVHHRRDHYYVLTGEVPRNNQPKKVYVYDSIPTDETHYIEVVNTFYWRMSGKRGEPKAMVKNVEMKPMARQSDNCSCGLFALLTTYALLKKLPVPQTLPMSQVHRMRAVLRKEMGYALSRQKTEETLRKLPKPKTPCPEKFRNADIGKPFGLTTHRPRKNAKSRMVDMCSKGSDQMAVKRTIKKRCPPHTQHCPGKSRRLYLREK